MNTFLIRENIKLMKVQVSDVNQRQRFCGKISFVFENVFKGKNRKQRKTFGPETFLNVLMSKMWLGKCRCSLLQGRSSLGTLDMHGKCRRLELLSVSMLWGGYSQRCGVISGENFTSRYQICFPFGEMNLPLL